MAPAFDRSEQFGLDKPACAACPKLGADDRCSIHDRLESEGFKGCVIFDCLGAGQRVVQELYAGRSWREEPALLPQMWGALKALRAVHEQILLLRAAAKLPLSPQERRTLGSLLQDVVPVGGWTVDRLEGSAGPIVQQAAAFIRSLRRHFSS